MKYILDSADPQQINEALSMGVCGITANPTLYRKSNQEFYAFLRAYAPLRLSFLSGEVMGQNESAMIEEALAIREIDQNIVIKINFSREGLKACRRLHEMGFKTAVTLIFTISQAMAAVNAEADYIFPFIGRNEEWGADGIHLAAALQTIIRQKCYQTRIVAASIKNIRQLEQLAEAGLDYAAVPYDLLVKSHYHPLTDQGALNFRADWDCQFSQTVSCVKEQSGQACISSPTPHS